MDVITSKVDKWRPLPKQHAFISCPTEDVLFGGSRGPGKTDGLLGDWMSHAETYGPHARGLFIRRTYPELEEVERRCHEIFPGMAKWAAAKRTWTWKNGATFRLRFLHRPDDAGQFQGHTNTWVGVDELTQWASPDPLDKLRATLRSPHGVPCYFRCTANPGGVGHGWVKARYIDPAPPYTEHYDDEMKTYRLFIPATLDDNPILQKKDPEYWRRIEASVTGRPDLLKAWRYGLWDIVAGGYFDDLWVQKVHILQPFYVPKRWKLDRTHDWGETAPFCTLWFAESNGEAVELGEDETRQWPRGTIFIVGEDYGWNGKPNQGLRLNATNIARRIREAEHRMGYTGRVQPGAADLPPIRSGHSLEQDMAQVGVRWLKPAKGPGSRVTGWSRIREYLSASLQDPMEKPGLFVFDTCRQFIRTFPVLPRDEKDPDDIDSSAEDHCADALRLRIATVGNMMAITRMRV